MHHPTDSGSIFQTHIIKNKYFMRYPNCDEVSLCLPAAGKATKAAGSVPAVLPAVTEEVKGEVIVVDDTSGILAQMYSGQTLAVTTLVSPEGTESPVHV